MEKITITAADGVAISALAYDFDRTDIKGIVVVCHGFGEHAAMYCEAAEALGQGGYASILFNQRGHGAPPGGRRGWFGVTPNYESFLDDVGSVAAAARKMAPGLPVALYGHSMGGNIAINALLREPSNYSCAILEAPWLELNRELNPLILGFAKLAGRLSHRLTTVNKLKPGALTSDPSRAERYIIDPLYHGRISFRMFSGIISGCKNALENASKLEVPVFIAYAGSDKVLCNDATLRFAADAGDIATIKEYDSRHAIHNDKSREGFFLDAIAFLDAVLANASNCG